MKITTSGIDVAKTVFQAHGIDEHGKVVLRRQLRRSQVLVFSSRLEPCLIGMEACASSHYWARKLIGLGHTVRLMAPQFVKPYRKNDKNDGNDAEAICEAVQRPSMRFVPVKSPEQQADLAIHRVRRRLMCERTALIMALARQCDTPQSETTPRAAGSSNCVSAAARTSPPWPWLPRTHASFGRSWSEENPRRGPQSMGSSSQPPKSHSIDCVKRTSREGRQVRPMPGIPDNNAGS